MKTTLLLALAFLLPGTLSAQFHVVDAASGPGSQYTQIHQAVAAAGPGDTILVRTGGYESFTVQGMGLVITTDLGAFVEVPRFYVKDVPAAQTVTIHGVDTNSFNDGPGLTVSDCDGPVWIEDCKLRGPLQVITSSSQGAGARVESSAVVSFHRCTLDASFAYSTHAGSGLLANDSLVALFDCDLTGGQGNPTADGYGVYLAGPGADVDGGLLFASGTSFTGGNGGSGTGVFTCVDAGDGAAGLVLDGGVETHLLDVTTTGGAGGLVVPPCGGGAPGPGQLVLSGTVLEQTFPARSLAAPNPVRAGETLTVSIDGVPGDLVFLWVSGSQAPLYVAPVSHPTWPIAGGLFLPDATASVVFAVGALPAGGAQLPFLVPSPPGVAAVHLYVQALMVSGPAADGFVVSSAQMITVLAAGL